MGTDILLLDLTSVTLIADYFVIATGDSDRQLAAMKDEVLQQVKATNSSVALAIEGAAESGWILLDFGSVVAHLFSVKQRTRYQLEELWHEARVVVRIA
jgi:ribosome-associated protein